jgi:hypothetical protein
MYVCMYVSIYIAHYRMELNPDLMTLFRFQFGRCDWTHHRMFNVISLKAIKNPCVMRAAFRRRDCYRFLTGSAGFRNQSLIAFFPKRWRSNPLHHHIPSNNDCQNSYQQPNFLIKILPKVYFKKRLIITKQEK